LVSLSLSAKPAILNETQLAEVAKATYARLLPCILDNPNAPSLEKRNFVFPSDAEAHYKELLAKTSKWRNHPVHEVLGFRGPWIENAFIDHFMEQPLSYFRGLFPLFVQFVDIHADGFMGRGIDHGKYRRMHEQLAEELAPMLRDDVMYVLVSQDDEGVSHKERAGLLQLKPNILVLSAGGHGHVPIPLIKGIHAYVEPPSASVTIGGNRTLVSSYKWRAGFYGSPGTNSSLPRRALLDEFARLLKDKQQLATTTKSNEVDKGIKSFTFNIEALDAAAFQQQHHHQQQQKGGAGGGGGGGGWKSKMLDTLFNLAPRGFGRTSYRLAEVIQMGKLPVYLYSDVPWLPYQGSNASVYELGFVGKAGHLDELLQELVAASTNEALLREKLEKVRRARTHYTMEGVLSQIHLFFSQPASGAKSLLSCQRVPDRVL